MTVDRDDLVLYALGEPVDPEAVAAIEADPASRREVEELRRTLRAARSVTAEDHRLTSPPELVWARIEQEAFGASATGDRTAGSGPVAAPPTSPSGPATAPPPGPPDPGGVVTSRWRGRRDRGGRGRSWWGPALVAAAAVVAVAAVGVGALLQPDRDGRTLAAATLEALRGAGAGEAEVRADDRGRVLLAETSDLPSTPGYYEVWLIDPDTLDMVSLGPVREDRRYPVPEGLDLERFSLVDVSAEPLDGDPTHSGDSLLRGALEETTRS